MLYLWYTFNPLSDFPYLIVKHKVELVFFFFLFFFYYCMVEIHIFSFSFAGNKSLFPKQNR